MTMRPIACVGSAVLLAASLAASHAQAQAQLTPAQISNLAQPTKAFELNSTLYASVAPVLIFGSTIATPTYSADALQYSVSPGGGNGTCTFVLQMEWTALSAGAGSVSIVGLPPTCSPPAGTAIPLAPVKSYGFNGAIDATIGSNGVISLTYQSAGPISSETAVQGTGVSATGGIYITETFPVAPAS